MYFDKLFLDNLTGQAKANPRLRQNYDLRNSTEDRSQRMLNALEPDTVVPVHRHRASSESVAVLRGAVRNEIYASDGTLTEATVVKAGSEVPGFVIPAGTWHRAVSLESGTVIMECKDGAWEPLALEDVLQLPSVGH